VEPKRVLASGIKEKSKVGDSAEAGLRSRQQTRDLRNDETLGGGRGKRTGETGLGGDGKPELILSLKGGREGSAHHKLVNLTGNDVKDGEIWAKGGT